MKKKKNYFKCKRIIPDSKCVKISNNKSTFFTLNVSSVLYQQNK